MKKWMAGLALAASLNLGLVQVARAEDKPKIKVETWKGQVLDMACYMTMGWSGGEHTACAKKCLKEGAPLGFLDESGKAYFITYHHEKDAPYQQMRKMGGEKVVLKGVKISQGGANAILLVSVEKAK